MRDFNTRVDRRIALGPGRGFTLIELLLVLVILAVLAGLVVPRFARRSEQAKITGAKTDISSLGTALRTFEIDCGRYPSTEETLTALLDPPSGIAKGWNGPYLEKREIPKDPWGIPYIYKCPGQHNPDGYDLYSFGSNMNDDNGGGDDINNWSER